MDQFRLDVKHGDTTSHLQPNSLEDRRMRSPKSRKPKILIVDDEPDNLDLLYRTFYREYRVLRAEDGVNALSILSQENNIAVIISDQRMPNMSGTELLSLTAEQYPDIIRIILTGYTDVDDLVEAINTGKVFKYVTKPWEPEELKAVVKQGLETHNLIKVRTQELRRSLRQESLLNRVTNTITNAQYGGADGSPLQEVLQSIVDAVGQVLDVNICILRPLADEQLVSNNACFVYQQADQNSEDQTPDGTPNHAVDSSDWLPNPLNLVWETRELEIIEDINVHERFNAQIPESEQLLSAFNQVGIRSTLMIPLISQSELMAVLALHRAKEIELGWEEDEIQLATMVADQAALAISQAQAYEQVRALAKREALVNTITSAIHSSLDPQDIFAAITKQLGQVLEADGCALSLWTEDDEYVQCVGLYDGSATHVIDEEQDTNSSDTQNPLINQQLPQSVVPIRGNPLLQQLLQTKQPVVRCDLEYQERVLGIRTPAKSLLLVPMIADGKIIGSISLNQTHHSRLWPNSAIELAKAVASQAAIAVQQARLYQKTRQQAERLLELDQQKTEFFQNVSHEFRTPLTLMIGPLEAAINQHQGLSPEASDIALRNSRRLLRLVNQILDLQRLDAGRMQARFRPCFLDEFVEQIVQTFQSYCDRKGLKLHTQLQKCEPVYLDLEKFDKVIYNLLSNAMKFTDPGGQIQITLTSAGEYVCLEVMDTGMGIAASQIPYLFDRFRQAEGSINRSHEGTGLGLAMVKELVELHGGQISVHSKYKYEQSNQNGVQGWPPHQGSEVELTRPQLIGDSGTVFTIWLKTGTAHLPLDMVIEVPMEVQSSRAAVELADLETELLDLDGEEQVETSTIEEEEASPNTAKILVVDDNRDLRTYLSDILRQAGYQVVTARNGEEGIRAAINQPPNLIVTDLMMPGVSGLDLIRQLRSDEELKGTPIILLTAKADEASRIDGTERGADAYLSKPFNDRELLAEVRNLLALKANEDRVKQLNTYLTESVLGRFLPPAMVKKAATGELTLSMEPEPRLVTILFSDIVGFTQLSNTLRSRRIAQLLNEYLEAMAEAVFANGGTVDKFVGDAIVALFGAPEESTPNEQVKRAIAAAKDMYQALAKLNASWEEQGIVGGDGPPPVQFRCGIHQGTAVVGLFGGNYRSDYTAVGPAVNIAARLQEASQPNAILVSAAVADYLTDDEITKGSSLKLKGVDETVLTFLVKIDSNEEKDG